MSSKISCKLPILASLLLTVFSCGRLKDEMSGKPIELAEITKGGFFFEHKGSWSYVELSDVVLAERKVFNKVNKDSVVVRTWKELAFYQVIYDIEKDSIFKLNGYFPSYYTPPTYTAITFYPFYVLKGETVGCKSTSKVRSRLYTINRGLWHRFTLGVDYDYGRYYKYVRMKPFKVWYKERFGKFEN